MQPLADIVPMQASVGNGRGGDGGPASSNRLILGQSGSRVCRDQASALCCSTAALVIELHRVNIWCEYERAGDQVSEQVVAEPG